MGKTYVCLRFSFENMLINFLKFPNNSNMPCYLSDFESIFLSLVKFVNSDTIFPSEQRETNEEKEMKKEKEEKKKKDAVSRGLPLVPSLSLSSSFSLASFSLIPRTINLLNERPNRLYSFNSF